MAYMQAARKKTPNIQTFMLEVRLLKKAENLS